VPTAVVTGAAGFLGSHAAAELDRRGWTVRGLDLRSDDERGILAADVRRPGPWCDTLDGADLVIHTAAIVAESGDRATFYDVNVGGTCIVGVAGGDGTDPAMGARGGPPVEPHPHQCTPFSRWANATPSAEAFSLPSPSSPLDAAESGKMR